MLIFQKMLTLFILMAVGYFMRIRGWITDENSGLLSKIVVNVANPAMIIAAGLNSASSISNRTLLTTFVIAVIFYAVLAVAAPLAVRLMRIPVNMRGTYQCMFIFGNIGFMGIPLITSVYGSEYALLQAMYNIVFLLLLYTYGVMLLEKEARVISGEQAAEDGKAVLVDSGVQWKKMINAGTVACVIAIICFLTKISVPSVLGDSFDMLSSLCAPLSMFSIGASLGTMKPKELVSDMRLNAFIAVRLLLVPIAAVALFRCFITDAMMTRTFYVVVSVPIGSICALMAEEYHGQKAAAARGVALSTLVSVITLPLVGMIFGL